MNPRTKLLIAQPDGAKLVSLLLWLEQYTDLEVVGTTCSGDKLAACTTFHQPEVVLLDFSLLAQDQPVIPSKIKATTTHPSILVMHESEIAPMESALGKDLDGYINPKLVLSELTECIRKAAQKRVASVAPVYVPATMAG
jgi:DNA-binding NarL/FixJ family response regulator